MKEFYRSKEHNMIGGVCGGLAEYFGIAPNLVRLISVFLALCTAGFPFLVTYLVALFVVPYKPATFDVTEKVTE